MNHAFIECKLIEPFIKHLKEILRDIYKVKILTFSIQHLLKIDCKSHCTLLFTIACWTIYKLIVNKNITVIDKRKVASRQNFLREITKRLESKSNIKMTRKLLPKELLGVILEEKKIKREGNKTVSIMFMLIMIKLLCEEKLNFNSLL